MKIEFETNGSLIATAIIASMDKRQQVLLNSTLLATDRLDPCTSTNVMTVEDREAGQGMVLKILQRVKNISEDCSC